MKNENELIEVIMQAFYGNRTGTEIRDDSIDAMLQGCLSSIHTDLAYEIDRSIVQIPGSKCIIVYNKYQEEGKREEIKQWFEEDGYKAKPLAFVPEKGVEIYSRCFVCRQNEEGELMSLQEEDYDIIFNYLAR